MDNSIPKRQNKLDILVKLMILLFFIIANLIQLNTGMADNGDFLRLAGWFSSGPTDFSATVTPEHPDYYLRYFEHWLPYWRLDFPLQGAVLSSALIIWLPGIMLNVVTVNANILYLPVVSIPLRVFLFCFIWLAFKYIDARIEEKRAWYYCLFVLPMVFVFSSTDYIAYLNTFYQEAVLLISFPFFCGIWLYLRYHRGRLRTYHYVLLFIGTLLLATTKASNLIIPLLAAPFLLLDIFPKIKPAKFILLILVFAILPCITSFFLTTREEYNDVYNYDSVYRGALLYSQEPEKRLKELGLEGTENCIDKSWYRGGQACAGDLISKLNFFTPLTIMAHEPGVALSELLSAANTMQYLKMDHLGYWEEGNPVVPLRGSINLWSKVKTLIFPRGWGLLVSLIFLAVLFIKNRKQNTMASDLSSLGLFLVVVCWVDMCVQIYADGVIFTDNPRHLLLANLAFDFAIILGLNVLVLWVLGNSGKIKGLLDAVLRRRKENEG
jgi:hypothetical protein